MGNFSKEVLNKKPLANNKLRSSGHWFIGQEAIDKVEELEGPLSPAQKRVVAEEGFVDVPYLDTNGIWTIGAGQTEAFKNKTFKESFLKREMALVKKIPKLSRLPEELQTELIHSAYRGGITGSPKTIKLINAGDLQGAADEFLDNDEFLNPDTPSGVVKRMSAVATALSKASGAEGEVKVVTQRQPEQENVAPVASEEVSGVLPEEKGGLTAEEEQELEFLRNDLASRAAEEEELHSVTGLTAEEEAELVALKSQLGDEESIF